MHETRGNFFAVSHFTQYVVREMDHDDRQISCELNRVTRSYRSRALEIYSTSTHLHNSQIHDAALLSVDKAKMPMRGFEEISGVQYAQSWDVEIV